MSLSLRHYGELLATYLRPQKGKVVIVAVLLVGNIVLQLISPRIVGAFLDGVQAGSPLDGLIRLALLFLVVVFSSKVVLGAASYLSADIGWTATNALRADLVEHCFSLDLSFHQAHTPGELIERIDGDVNVLAEFFSTFVIYILSSVLMFSGAVVLLWLMDWRLGLVMAVACLATLVMFRFLHSAGVPYSHASRQAAADLSGFWAERLGGREDIRASGAEAHALRRMHQLMRARLYRALQSQFISGVLVNSWFIIYTVGNGSVMLLGVYLVGRGTLTVGDVFIAFRYASLLMDNLRVIVWQVDRLQRATASLQRIRELYFTTSRVRGGLGEPLPAGALAVAFDDVSFAYTPDVPVLRNLAFQLQPGSVLGLLGRTGSGKTTLTRLLFRFYDPTAGAVRVNGVDLRHIRLPDLRQRIGIVTQEVQLFRATVRDNLTFFDTTISDERIWHAFRELGLETWFRSLPTGLDTELAASSSTLSAGEAQLLAFTRIFLKNPSLVILDEASSRLDPATERLIEGAITRLLAGRTAIIIAHRLATVHRADAIMILDAGRIVEHGPRQALAQDASSRFARLLQTGLEEVLA